MMDLALDTVPVRLLYFGSRQASCESFFLVNIVLQEIVKRLGVPLLLLFYLFFHLSILIFHLK